MMVMAYVKVVTHLWVLPLILSSVCCTSVKDMHSPCYGCQLFNILQKDHAVKPRQKDENGCVVPCYCPVKEISCNEGISTVKDGCSCCYMCARQHGDMCSVKDKCDASKELFCDMSSKNGQEGFCKAITPKACSVNGVTYKDGDQFQLDCSNLCTCQNGIYGCVSLCPQEHRKPSEDHCPSPQLMPVPGQCCKDWTCQEAEDDGSDKFPRHATLENESYETHYIDRNQIESGNLENQHPPCPTNKTDWGPCSATCGAGLSIRFASDNCRVVQQTRICMLRPCGTVVDTVGRHKCTPTTRSEARHRIVFQNCHSVKEYKLKFCTTCKKNRCCYPRKTRVRPMEFECSGGRREYKKYMWIKSCRCDRECYKVDSEKKTKTFWERDMPHW